MKDTQEKKIIQIYQPLRRVGSWQCCRVTAAAKYRQKSDFFAARNRFVKTFYDIYFL